MSRPQNFLFSILTFTFLLLTSGSALLTSTAHALKFPHAAPNINLCSDCHSRTGAGFATITSQNSLCISAIGCHNPGGRAEKKALSTLDASNRFGNIPAESGAKQSSHGWKIPNLNPDAGVTKTDKWGELATGPQGAALNNKITCTRCHRAHGEKTGYVIHEKFLRQTPKGNYICFQCHAARQISNVRDPKPADKHYSHPVEVNYSSVRTAKPEFFYSKPQNQYSSNPSAILKLFTTVNVDQFGRVTGVKGRGQVVCSTCHGPLHSADSNPYTFDNITTYSKTGNYSTSGGNLLRRYPVTKSNDLCLSCHKVKTHREFLCSRCHTPHKKAGENNRYLVHENISTPNSGRKAVQLLSTSNMARRWQDDSTPIPVCQACHTQTRHHRNYSTATADRTHNYLNDGTGKYKFCAKACHKHTSSFSHGSGSGGGKVEDCLPCHGHDPGYAFSYNGKNYVSEGTGNKVTHSTHTENDSDDLRGPNIFCTTCHDENNMPYFKTGTDTNGDGKFELSETNVCDPCHSPGGSFNGVNSVNGSVGAKDNFKAENGDYANGGVYNQSDGSLKPGKENWCAGCHDESPSTIGLETAPNKVGDNSTYGFFVNGHGRWNGNYNKLSHQDSTATGNPAANKNCADCHDSTKQHIVVGTNPTHKRLRALTNNDATDQINVCNLCHVTNGAASAAPYFYMGPGKYTNSAHSVKKCTDCHEVHGPSGGAPGMTKKDRQNLCYDCHTGGVVRNDAMSGFGTATSIKQAFNLGGSKHPLGQSFSKGGKSYTLQCTSCHNVHVVTGKYWDAAKGKSPLTLFSNNTSPWGDKSGQKMKDFANNGTYDTPLFDVELGANFRDSVMPDYPTFCLDCHSEFGGSGFGGIDWNGNVHGKKAANTPAAYGGHNYWSVGMQGFDSITPGFKAKRGRGGRDHTYAPWDSERRYAGANFTLACVNCHEVHGSGYDRMMRPELMQNGTICQNCHWAKSEIMNGGLFGCGPASCHQNNNIHRLGGGAGGGGAISVFDREHTVSLSFDSAWQYNGDHPGGFVDTTKTFSNARFLNMSSAPITSVPETTGICYAGGWSCGRCDWLTTLSDVQARVLPGKVGNAVKLNGQQCVEVGTESCYSSIGTGRGTAAAYEWIKTGTVEAWVYPTELTGTRYVIASNEKYKSKNYSLEITNDSVDTINSKPAIFTDYRLVFRFHLMSFFPNTGAVYSNIPVPLNQWTHVAAVYDSEAPDGKRAKIYMNGVDVTAPTGYVSNTIFSQPPKQATLEPGTYWDGTNTQPLMIGCDPNIIDNRVNNSGYDPRPFTPFKGMIDEFNLWNIARTPEQILQSYGAPRIASATGSIGNSQVTVAFSEGVYSNSNGTGALSPASFTLTDTDNGRTITSVSHTAGSTTAVLTLSSPLDSLNDIDVDTVAAANGSSIYDNVGISMDTRATKITAAAPVIASIIASDVAGSNGIQAGDKVVVKFNSATQGNAIDKWNINSALALPGGHTWNDGSGNIGSATWNSPTNDTLTIILSATTSAPTVAPGDLVTLGNIIKSSSGADIIDAHPISGTFDSGNFGGLPSGVVAYYNFAEGTGLNAHDTSGNGNNATLKNGAWWSGGRTGIVPNYAVTLNGISNFVEAPDSNSLDLTDQGTIEVWAKKNANKPYQAYVAKYAISGSPLEYYGYMLGDEDGQISVRWGRPQISVRDPGTDYNDPEVRGAGYRYYRAGKDDALLTDCETAPVGQWNHIVATYNGSEIKIFLNGRLLKTGPYVKPATPNSYPLRIGASGSGDSNSYDNVLDGAVDEAVVYNRALTNDEVRERYGSAIQANGAIAYDVAGAEGIQPGDKVILRFDGPTNGIVINSSNIDSVLSLNNGHTWGSITSAVWSTNTYTSDTLTITLNTGATIANGDTITPNGSILKDRKGNAISATVRVGGKFGPLPSGVVAYYDFNEGSGNVVHDLTTNGFDGIAIGGTSWMPGKDGQGYALNLDGYSGYVRVSECGDTPLDLTRNGTFEFWLKKDASGVNTYPAFLSKGQRSVSNSSIGEYRMEDTLGYNFYWSTNEKRLNVNWGGEGGSNSGSSPNYQNVDGAWKHVVVTYDGDARFYIDGQPVGSSRVSTLGRKSNDPLMFGAYPYFNGLYAPYFLDGALDEAIIYNRTLAPEEVRENSGIPWAIKTAVASDMGGAAGIQGGDRVVVTFNGPTQGNAVTAANIDAVLALPTGKTWKSGNGSIGNAVWSTDKFSNDTLTIILSDVGGVPNVAVGDTVTLDGVTVKDHKGRPVPVSTVTIGGIFDALPGDIVGYWNFSDGSGTTASDSSIYKNHGTLTGAAWTAGQDGGAVRFNGAGAAVTVNDSNSLDLSTRDFYAIRMFSRTEGWAVGQAGAMQHWTDKYSPDHIAGWSMEYYSPTKNHLYGVDVLSNTEAYVVGAGGLISRYNGYSWGTPVYPVTVDLYSIDMLASNSGWAVGKNNTILRFNGAAWSPVAITLPTATWTLKSVKMLSSTEGWAVGGDNITTGVILKWNGTTWTEVFTTTATNLLTSIDMVSSTDGWVVGLGGKIFKFDGTAWTAFTSPVAYDLHGVKALTSSEAWIVGANRTILMYDGTAWTISANTYEVTGSPTLRAIDSVQAQPSDDTTYVDYTKYEYVAGESSVILKHSDGYWKEAYGVTNPGSRLYVSWFGTYVSYDGATFEIWAKKNSNKADQTYITKQNPSMVIDKIHFRIKEDGTTGKPSFTFNKYANTPGPATCSDAAPVSQWNHIVATAGNGMQYIYLNGQLCGSTNIGAGGGSTFPLFIGSGGGGYGSTDFDGDIDQVTIYNRVLTADEVWQKAGSGVLSVKSATADDKSGGGSGIQAGDRVIIKFSGPTKATSVTAANINTRLTVSGKTWLDGSGNVTAAWSTTTFTNDTLTVTLGTTSGVPTIAVGNTITLSGLLDSLDRPIAGTVVISGSFGSDVLAWTLDTLSEWQAGSLAATMPSGEVVTLSKWDAITYDIKAVDMVSATEGWAVGERGSIRKYDGTSWNAFPSPLPYSGGNLNAVDMLNSSLGWAVGDSGRILKFDGTKWSEETSPITTTLYAVRMISATEGWAGGTSGKILKYDGTNWTSVTSPTTLTVYALDAVSSTDIWAVGSSGLILRWNGSAWATVAGPSTNSLYSIHMLSATEGWAVGLGGKIIKWDGANWTTVAGPTTSTLYSVRMVSATEGWAFAGTGSIYPAQSTGIILKWNGTAWSLFASPEGPAYFYSANMISATDGWVVGNDGAIYRYNGTAWSAHASVYSYAWINDMQFVSDTDGWAVGQGKVLRYNGTGWTTFANLTTKNFAGIDMLSANEGWVAGPNDFFWRYLNGAWTSFANPAAVWMNAIDMVSSTDGWAVGDSGNILRWNGSSWASVASPTTNSLRSIEMLSATEGWAVGMGGMIIKWDGTSWTTVASPTTNTIMSIDMISSTEGWAVGYDGASPFYGIVLKYDGASWTQVSVPSSIKGLQDIRMRSSTEGMAVGYNGGVITYDGTSWKYSETPTQASDSYSNYVAAYTPSGTPWVVGYAKLVKGVGYFTRGTVVNSFDAGRTVDWLTHSYDASTPSGTSVAFRWATSNDGSVWSSWTNNIATLEESRWIRQEITLTSNSSTVTPSVSRTTVEYRVPLVAGAIAYWDFDIGSGTSVTDTTGNGNTISWSTNPASDYPTWVPGKQVNALDFDGTTDRGFVAYNTTQNLGTGDFTIETWLKFPSQNDADTGGAGGAPISQRWSTSTGYEVVAGLPTPGKVRLKVGADYVDTVADGMNDDAWRQFIFVRSGTSLKVYINGVLNNAVTAGSVADVNTGRGISIGYARVWPDDYYSNWYNGSIDKTLIYNRALTDAEVQTRAGIVTTPPAAPVIGTPQVLSASSIRWNFTETASDEDGFKLHDSAHAVKATEAVPSRTYMDETGLAANTQFTRHVHSYNAAGDSTGSADATAYTLAADPAATPSRAASSWSNSAGMSFINAAGFGAGGVQYYRYAWDQSATHTWTGTETQWTSGALSTTATSVGSWYLHLKSYNAEDTAGSSQDLGPFNYETALPSQPAGVSAVLSGGLSVNLSWSAATDTGGSGVGGYLIESAVDYSGTPGSYSQAGTTTGLSFLNSGLLRNVKYWHRVRAYDNAGNNGPYSTEAMAAYTLPAPPSVTSNTVTGGWSGVADVIFTNAAGFGAGGVQYYRVAWDQNATHTFTDSETQWSSGTLTGTMAAEGSWYLHVKSFNADGVANGTADYGPYNYDVAPPTGLVNAIPANGATGIATVSTVASGTAADGGSGGIQYFFQAALDSGFVTGVQSSGWQGGASFAPTLSPGTTYYWHVKARDSVYNETAYTATWSFTTVMPPAAPTMGAAAALSATSIRWNFTDNASDENGFRLYNASHIVMASSAAQNLTYLDETGLVPNTQYTRHVHAYNAIGDSTGSGDASRYTLPLAPNVTADKTASTWYNTADVVFTNAAGFGTGGVQYYRYAWDQNATYTFLGTEPQWTTGTLTRTATADGSWYLHVKSYNGDNVDNGTANYGPFNYDGTFPAGLANSTPVDASPAEPTSVVLNAAAATDGGSGSVQYYFQVALNSGFSSGVQNSGWQAGTSYAPVLNIGTTYYWHVKARDAALNETAYSATWSFTTSGTDSTPPSQVTGLNAVGGTTTTSMNLTWTASTDAGGSGLAGYKIERANDVNGAPGTYAEIAISATESYVDSTVTANTPYWYRVRAYDNAGNNGNYSTGVYSAGIVWTLQFEGSNLTRVAWSNTLSRYVAVGASGRILTSSDAQTWTYQNSGTMNALQGITWTGTQFVAAGASGTILTSPDGITWTVQTSGTSLQLNGVVWSSSLSLHVAVGATGTVITSPDGVTWTSRTSGTTSALNAVAWSGAQFVAVGASGTNIRSADGVNWTLNGSAAGRSNPLRDIIWAGSQFVVPGQDGGVYKSSDGITWTFNGFAGSTQFYSVAYNGSTHVVTGQNGVLYTSTDLATWTARPSGTSISLNGVVWTGSRFVAVGDYSAATSSADGLSWTVHREGASAIFYGAAWSGSKAVATGASGAIYTSTDMINWTNSRIHSNLNGIVWSSTQSQFVEVGAGGVIRTSPDGLTWTRRNSGTTNNLVGVTWSGSQYIGVGVAGTVLTSPDGVTWTARSSGVSTDLQAVAWSGTLSTFIAVGSQGTIIMSSDGITWSPRTDADISTAFNYLTLKSVVWTGAQFITVGTYGKVYTSPDGATDNWTLITDTDISTNTLNGVVWTGSQYAIVGNSGKIFTSPDAATENWTLRASGTTNSLSGVVWTGSQFVIVGGGATASNILTSPDGATWTARTVGSNKALYGVAWSGTKLVAVGNSGITDTSSDGITWTYSGVGLNVYSVVWTGTKFIAVGAGTTTAPAAILTSTDGTDWTGQSAGLANNTVLRGIVWSGTQLVAVGSGGSIITSPDGIAWTGRTSGTTNYLYGVAWSGTQFVAVGASGTILTSNDGITWTTQTSGTTNILYGVAWLSNKFVAVGASGTILTSSDGTTWTAQTSGTTYQLNGVISTGAQFVATGNTGTILTSPDGINWISRSGATVNLNGAVWSPELSRLGVVGATGTVHTSR